MRPFTIGRLRQRRQRGRYTGGPGRPKGLLKGQGTNAYELKELKPIHDHILLLHLAGRSNKEIGEILQISPQTVYNVIRSPLAKERLELLRHRVRGNILSHIDDQLIGLAATSIDNLRRTVDAPISPLHPMKRHQDKVGLDLLQGVGFLKGARSEDDSGRLSFGPEAGRRLASAIERANAVRERHSSPSDSQNALPEGSPETQVAEVISEGDADKG